MSLRLLQGDVLHGIELQQRGATGLPLILRHVVEGRIPVARAAATQEVAAVLRGDRAVFPYRGANAADGSAAGRGRRCEVDVGAARSVSGRPRCPSPPSGWALALAHVMALLASGMALAMMAVRVMALLALVMVSLAPALLLLPPLALLALVLVGTRVRRLEQLKTRRTRQRDEASGLVRGQQQLPRLQAAVAAAEA